MKGFSYVLVSILMLLIIVGCKNYYLRGYFTRETFINQCRWKKPVADNYKPEKNYLDSLATADSFDVKLFVGTWCSDSRKWVPRFFAIQPQLPVRELSLISVDTTKKDLLGLSKIWRVDSLPTFIFLRSGREIGRMVEKPFRKKLERAIWQRVKPTK